MTRDCLDCRTNPAVQGKSRCASCEAERERRRGTPAKRGYGAQHQKAREALARNLPDVCGYCQRIVRPTDRWVAAHVVDGNPSMGWMVAHPTCNERAKVRR